MQLISADNYSGPGGIPSIQLGWHIDISSNIHHYYKLKQSYISAANMTSAIDKILNHIEDVRKDTLFKIEILESGLKTMRSSGLEESPRAKANTNALSILEDQISDLISLKEQAEKTKDDSGQEIDNMDIARSFMMKLNNIVTDNGTRILAEHQKIDAEGSKAMMNEELESFKKRDASAAQRLSEKIGKASDDSPPAT